MICIMWFYFAVMCIYTRMYTCMYMYEEKYIRLDVNWLFWSTEFVTDFLYYWFKKINLKMNAGDSSLTYLHLLFKTMTRWGHVRENIEKGYKAEARELQCLEVGHRTRRLERKPRKGSQ